MTVRDQSLQNYIDLPEPNTKDPAWRFANPRNYRLEDTSPAPGCPEETLAKLHNRTQALYPEAATHITMAGNNQAMEAHLANEGLEIQFSDTPFTPLPTLGADKFQALNIALAPRTLRIRILKDADIPKPILITHWATSGNTYPQILIEAGENSNATILELYLNSDDYTPSYNNAATRLQTQAGSHLTRLCVHHRNPLSTDIHLETLQVARDSVLNNHNLNLGSLNLRQETSLTITGSGVDAHLNSLTIASAGQEIDQRTLQKHLAPDSNSRLLFKNALEGQARTIFSGMIDVGHDAQRTDAFQTNRNLLLDDTAEANSLPGLEIHANDVKCSHGATTGQIDPELVYYMRTRGIPTKMAKKLLVYGFFEEILQTLPPCEILNKQIRSWIEKQFSLSQ
jgi:Fe-S cluster assembly protein SufD